MTRKKRVNPNRHRVIYYGRKVLPKPPWMRVTRLIGMVVITIVMILAMIGMAVKYYHLVVKQQTQHVK
jgi:hypothetical protein